MIACVVFLLSALLGAAGSGAARAEKRVALIIGNSAYEHASELPNPRNDAADITAVLEKLGFEIVSGVDLDKAGMDNTIREFANKLTGAGTGLFFYAGHGMQVGGVNYLVPVDAELTTAAALDFEMVRLDLVQRTMERESKTNILFLDACRDNPLARNLARSMGTRSGSIGRGLAAAESGVGTLISYSTQPGNVALDGQGRNSPFAAALVAQIATPGDDLSAMLVNVRRAVMQATNDKQVPWEHSALTGRFYFVAGSAPATSIAKPAAAAGGASTQTANADAEQVAMLAIKPDAGSSSPTAHGRTFRDCPNICPEMIVIGPGQFVMGSEDGDADESPTREVAIRKPFAAGRFEVTFAEWDACVNDGGCSHKPEADWGRGPQPVIRVSWNDVTSQYLPWLSRRAGKTYRLLTEAEWEFAARAGTKTRFEAGLSLDRTRGQFADRRSITVDALAPDRWSRYGMAGNVWEWVQDCYSESYSSAPTDGSAAPEDDKNCLRVVRGGSWKSKMQELRPANREWNDPATRNNTIGFRVARSF